MAEKADYGTTRMLFVGPEYDNGKKSFVWVTIDDYPNIGETLDSHAPMYRYFGRQKGGSNLVKGLVKPGAIFEFKCADENREKFFLNGDYVGMWNNNDDVTEWEAANRTFLDAEASRAERSKALRQQHVNERLLPLKQAYARLSPQQRRLLLAYIMEYITSTS